MSTVRLTAAQALVRYLASQWTVTDGTEERLFAGCWAIFGHGNVAGLGEALFHAQDMLPTFRAHNEQAMALAAVAYAKARNRRQVMACTSSIGPGAMNMLTAAGVAHVNRLPVLLLPGDVFANRRPDPVLQQIEDWGDGIQSVNDCFRPVSRYWDRITRPEQLLVALPRAIAVLTDPAECGPVTLSLCQDVQTEAFDIPERFFERQVHRLRRPMPDEQELNDAISALRAAKKPLIVAGGGVLYSSAVAILADFAERHAIPVAETQAGKGSLAWDHPQAAGAIGVTGTSAANTLAHEADLVMAVGTRLQDFTTGSRALIRGGVRLVQLNVQAFDAGKHGALPLVGDAQATLTALGSALAGYASSASWQARVAELRGAWVIEADRATAPGKGLPTDAQVLGAVNRAAGPEDVVVCAAGGLPGELHKLWRATGPGSYHLEYGFSCMGYEIAGGLGVRMARPAGEVFVLVGDGSYLMMNSELQTSIRMRQKLVVIVLDNHGFGCIDRLQRACGGESFNNLLADGEPWVDFAAHARALGAHSTTVTSIAELEGALADASCADRTGVIVIPTDPRRSTESGGGWWDVPIPEVSSRPEVRHARGVYETSLAARENLE